MAQVKEEEKGEELEVYHFIRVLSGRRKGRWADEGEVEEKEKEKVEPEPQDDQGLGARRGLFQLRKKNFGKRFEGSLRVLVKNILLR